MCLDDSFFHLSAYNAIRREENLQKALRNCHKKSDDLGDSKPTLTDCIPFTVFKLPGAEHSASFPLSIVSSGQDCLTEG